METNRTGPRTGAEPAATLIDARIAALPDWRGETLARIRTLVRQADPRIVEEWKWQVPVWSLAGILCTGEVYKAAVKMTFARGALLADPAGLFNASLQGGTRRAIDFREGDRIDGKALQALVRAAIALNLAGAAKTGPDKGAAGAAVAPRAAAGKSGAGKSVAGKAAAKKATTKPTTKPTGTVATRKAEPRAVAARSDGGATEGKPVAKRTAAGKRPATGSGTGKAGAAKAGSPTAIAGKAAAGKPGTRTAGRP